MSDIQMKDLAKLRIVVGYLGEKEQYHWWGSSFFSSTSDAFLSPVFPRTQLLAQATGVSRAASLVHDERIGVGDVFHLFRLPEEMAQGIHQALQNPDLKSEIEPLIAGQAEALAFLQEGLNLPGGEDVGPVNIGGRSALRDSNYWDIARGYYAKAFSDGIRIFPYFSGKGL